MIQCIYFYDFPRSLGAYKIDATQLLLCIIIYIIIKKIIPHSSNEWQFIFIIMIILIKYFIAQKYNIFQAQLVILIDGNETKYHTMRRVCCILYIFLFTCCKRFIHFS